MVARVRKWGNSLGVRIPKPLAEQVGIAEGSAVEFLVRDGAVVVRPCRESPLRLEDLLRRMSRRNRHETVDTGTPVGRETW